MPSPVPSSERDSGLSLVEVMVAMGLFVIGSLSLLSLLTSSVSSTSDNRARVVAANLAASDIDQARTTPYDALTVGTTTTYETVGGRSYRVIREVDRTMASGGSGCITNGGLREREKRVSTRVDLGTGTSTDTGFRGSTAAVRADTVVSAPVFDPLSPRGAIGFQVLDREGRPKQGLPVTTNSTSVPTDANGCSFFPNLLPGPYDVTVAWTGAVTVEGSSDLRQKVEVRAGQITTASLRVDRAASFTVDARTFGTATPGSFPFPAGLSAKLATPSRNGPTRLSAAQPVTGSPLSFPSFPELGGYEAYLGACSVSVRTPSEPATNATLELPLSPVTVVLQTQNNSMNPGAQDRGVEVTWLSTPTCAETYTSTTKTPSGCSGSTNPESSSACKLYLSLPAGRWRFKATGVVFNTEATVLSKTATQVIISW